jgi:hypothetical protein
MGRRVADRSSVFLVNFYRDAMVEEVMEAESSRKSLGGNAILLGGDCCMDQYY